MTSEEFAVIAKKDPVVIVPVGALEEHGRHLPLGADVIQPLHVVDEVARRTNAYVAPAIPYGVCTTTRPYPGTVSVSVDALKGFVRDVLADFVRNGVRRVMILSGHAGREHMMALRAAAQEVVDEGTGLRATVLSDYDIIYASQGILPEGDGHAGAGETSRMMTARPDLVKGKSPPGKNEIPSYAVVSDPRKYWSGVTGDPSKASKKFVVIVDDAKLVRRLGTRTPLPVEVHPFGWKNASAALEGLGAKVELRKQAGEPFRTDNGNHILDAHFGPIRGPVKLAARISGIPGVVGPGLRLKMAHAVVGASQMGVRTLEPTRTS